MRNNREILKHSLPDNVNRINYRWLLILFFIFGSFSGMCANFTWQGKNSIWTDTRNWNNNGIPGIADIVTIPAIAGNIYPDITASVTAAVKDITIAAGASINISGGILQVAGNWTNNGTFTTTGGTVQFMATGTVSGTSATTFPDIIINPSTGNSAITLGTNASCTSLVFSNSAIVSSLLINTGVTLTVNGDVTINQPLSGASANYHNLNIYDGTANIKGNLIFNVIPGYSAVAKTTINNGKLTVSGDIRMYNSVGAAMSLIDMSTGTGSLYLGGNFSVPNVGTLLPGTTSNFIYNGAGTQTITYKSGITYSTLTIDKASLTVLDNALTLPNLTLKSGYLNAGTYSITIYGNLINNGGDFTGFPSVYFIQTGSISGTNVTNFGPIYFNTGSTTSYTISSNINCTGLTIPEINTATSITSTANIIVNGNATIMQPSVSLTTAWNINGGTVTVAGDLTISSKSNSTGRIIKLSIGNGNLNVNGNINYNVLLGAEASALVEMTSAAGMLNLKGNLSLINGAGTFSSTNTGTINFNGSSAQTIDVSTAFKFNNFNCTNPVSVTLNRAVASIPITGDINIQSGVFSNGGIGINMSGGKTLQVQDGATLRLTGTTGMVSGSGVIKTFSVNSTVDYAGTSQAIAAETYGNLLISGTAAIAAGTCTITGNFNVASAAAFNASNFRHLLYKNFISAGTFTSTGSIQFVGNLDASISGTTAFNNLTVNKTSGSVTLQNSVTAPTVSMTAGTLLTGTHTLTITSDRTGNGIILGNIKRSHSFTGGVAYAFESPNNTITFSSPTAISSVTVSVTTGAVSDFTNGTAINRQYSISIAGGSYSTAALRLHYENNELNGLIEPDLQLWKYNSGWTLTSKTSSDTSANYVELTGIADISGRWTLSSCNLKTSFTYTGSPYCSNGGTAVVTYTSGGSAGTFSSSPSGLVLNSSTGDVNLAGSTPGTYTVTNTKSNGSCSSSSTASLTINAAGRWTGAVSSDWSDAGNWFCGGVPTSSVNVFVPGGLTNYPVINSGSASVNNLNIQTGASVNVSNAMLKIAGTITNAGTIGATTGTIELNGSAAQTIPASLFSTNQIKALTINNNAGVTLAGTLALTDVLTIANGALNTGGFLTLKSTATSTARVAPITSGAATPITGNVTVERYIPGRRKYRLVTSSVTTSGSATLTAGQEALSIWGNWQNSANTSLNNMGIYITGGSVADGFDQLTSNPSMFTYSAANRNYVPFSSANGSKTKYTPLKAGVAYYLFVYGDRKDVVNTATPNYTVLSATGTLLTGDQTYNTASSVPLSNVVGQYSLLGNPFASPVNWATVLKTNIDNTFWGWDPNLGSTGGYVTVSTTGNVTLIAPFTGSPLLDQYIQPGQGFFVRTSAPSPSLVIREQDKVSNYNANAFRVKNDLPLLAVNLYYNNAGEKTLADGVVAAFSQSLVTINNAGSSKMANTNETLSILKDNKSLSIDLRNIPVKNDSISLGLDRLQPRSYTLEIFGNQLESFVFKPYLQDRYLNTIQPLSASDTNKINFNISASDPSSRFRILFLDHPPALTKEEESIQVFPNPVTDKMNLSVNDLEAGEYFFSLFSPTGQLIKQQVFNHTGGIANFLVALESKYSKGMYYVEFSNSKRTLKQKIFITN